MDSGRDAAMRRLEITDREIMEIALRNEILRSEEARYDHRLHGVLLVSQGMSCYEVGKKFGHDPTTIQRWVRDDCYQKLIYLMIKFLQKL